MTSADEGCRIRGVLCGTGSYAVMDANFYDWLVATHKVIFERVYLAGFFYAVVYFCSSRERKYLHDLVMEFHDMHEGEEYDYLEFQDTWGDVSGEDYLPHEIMSSPAGPYCSMDCRFSNLKSISKREVEEKAESEYKGIAWDENKKKWRAYLNAAENSEGGQKMLPRYKTSRAAAMARDIALLETNSNSEDLNFPVYRDEFRHLLSDPNFSLKDLLLEVRTQNNYRNYLGYEAIVYDRPESHKPYWVLNKTYPTIEEAVAACEAHIYETHGCFVTIYSNKPPHPTTKKMEIFCPICHEIVSSDSYFFRTEGKGTSRVCARCYQKKDIEDLPSADTMAIPATPSGYKKCKRCKNTCPESSEYFPTYGYKGETKLLGTCRDCMRKADRNRYHKSKKEIE